MYWIDFADNKTSKYQLIGQVTNFERVNQSFTNFIDVNNTFINESLFEPEPACEIFVWRNC